MSKKKPSDWKATTLGELLGDKMEEYSAELCDILNDSDGGQDSLIRRLKEFFNRKDVAARLKHKETDPDYLAYCISFMFAGNKKKEDDTPWKVGLPPHSQN